MNNCGKNRIMIPKPGKATAAVMIVLAVLLFSSRPGASAENLDLKAGEALFNKHCASCHPKGGNILNPKRTLSREDRHAYNIITAQDIVYKMRNSGPAPTHTGTWSGMKMFDEQSISNDDALKIAEYIIQTFQ
jgi:cytochrome c6